MRFHKLGRSIVYGIFGAMVSMALSACAALPKFNDTVSGTANEKVTPGALYRFRAELQIYVDGVHFDGLGVTKVRNEEIVIDVQSKFGLDRIQFTTCARQDVFRNVDQDWFGKSGTIMHYKFVPNKQELSGQCPMYIEAFNKASLAAWGFLAFRSDENLPAIMGCNGESYPQAGFSVCQSLAGLKQILTFDTPIVDFEAEPICSLTKIDDKNFGFKTGSGICRATFYDGKRWHSMISFGYDKVLVQGE